jgi:ABC-type transporter MlaC component
MVPMSIRLLTAGSNMLHQQLLVLLLLLLLLLCRPTTFLQQLQRQVMQLIAVRLWQLLWQTSVQHKQQHKQQWQLLQQLGQLGLAQVQYATVMMLTCCCSKYTLVQAGSQLSSSFSSHLIKKLGCVSSFFRRMTTKMEKSAVSPRNMQQQLVMTLVMAAQMTKIQLMLLQLQLLLKQPWLLQMGQQAPQMHGWQEQPPVHQVVRTLLRQLLPLLLLLLVVVLLAMVLRLRLGPAHRLVASSGAVQPKLPRTMPGQRTCHATCRNTLGGRSTLATRCTQARVQPTWMPFSSSSPSGTTIA